VFEPGSKQQRQGKETRPAACLAHAWAGNAGVVVSPRVTAASLFVWVCKGAFCPVVHVMFGAGHHLQAAAASSGGRRRRSCRWA
jgi:hypothetical protein